MWDITQIKMWDITQIKMWDITQIRKIEAKLKKNVI